MRGSARAWIKWSLAPFVVIALIVAGCSSGGTTASSAPPSAAAMTKVKIVLQWVTQAQFAGYYAAVAKGYYKNLGLDVTIIPGGPDVTPEQLVLGGQADFGASPLTRTLAAHLTGADLVSVAEIIQHSPVTMISFKEAGIATPADMKGKTIGSWLGGNESDVFACLRKNNIDPSKDVTVVKEGFDMSQLLNHEVQAAQALTYNEYAQILETNNPATGALYQPSELNVIKIDDCGTSTSQDQIFTTGALIKKSPDTVQRFLEATFRGWIYCRDNPSDCVSIVLAAGSALGQSHQEWQMNEVNALIWPSTNGIGVPYDDKIMPRSVDIAVTYKVIPNAPPDDSWINLSFAKKANETLKAAGLDINGAGFKKTVVVLKAGGK